MLAMSATNSNGEGRVHYPASTVFHPTVPWQGYRVTVRTVVDAHVKSVSNATRSPRYNVRLPRSAPLRCPVHRRLSSSIGIAVVDSSSAASRGEASAVSMRSVAGAELTPPA